jgi:hypothetical protein
VRDRTRKTENLTAIFVLSRIYGILDVSQAYGSAKPVTRIVYFLQRTELGISLVIYGIPTDFTKRTSRNSTATVLHHI